MTTCRSCGAPMVWAITTGGKRMPLDSEDGTVPARFNDGNVLPTGKTVPTDRGAAVEVTVVSAGEQSLFALENEERWRSHFASCEQADNWRKK
jgi:sugar lactone lactonase YvrE